MSHPRGAATRCGSGWASAAHAARVRQIVAQHLGRFVRFVHDELRAAEVELVLGDEPSSSCSADPSCGMEGLAPWCGAGASF